MISNTRWAASDLVFLQTQDSHVFQIARAPGGFLRRDQVFLRSDIESHTLKGHFFAPFPSCGEVDARRGCLHVDSRTITKDRNFSRGHFFRCYERGRAEPSRLHRLKQATGIFDRSFDQNVEIKSGAWHSIEDRGDAADHQVLNFVGAKRFERALKAVDNLVSAGSQCPDYSPGSCLCTRTTSPSALPAIKTGTKRPLPEYPLPRGRGKLQTPYL